MTPVDSSEEGLLVLWTTADRETALHMVFMYTANARRHGWWPQVTLLVWGGGHPGALRGSGAARGAGRGPGGRGWK